MSPVPFSSAHPQDKLQTHLKENSLLPAIVCTLHGIVVVLKPFFLTFIFLFPHTENFISTCEIITPHLIEILRYEWEENSTICYVFHGSLLFSTFVRKLHNLSNVWRVEGEMSDDEEPLRRARRKFFIEVCKHARGRKAQQKSLYFSLFFSFFIIIIATHTMGIAIMRVNKHNN